MIRQPLRTQAPNGGATAFKGLPAKAIVIKPLESVYKRVEAEQRHKQRPVSQLGFHQLLYRLPEPTKRDRSISNRKGLFQLELEKSNKYNLPDLNQSWLTTQQLKTQRFSNIPKRREVENKEKPRQNCWYGPPIPQTKCFTSEIGLSDESLLLSNAVEEFRQASYDMSPCFNWRDN